MNAWFKDGMSWSEVLAAWPRDVQGRLVCSSAMPMPVGDAQRDEAFANLHWAHESTVDDGSCSNDCCDYVRCTSCGHRFRVPGEDS